MATYFYDYKCIAKGNKADCLRLLQAMDLIEPEIKAESGDEESCCLRFVGKKREMDNPLPIQELALEHRLEIACNRGIVKEFDLDDWYVDCGGEYSHFDPSGSIITDECPRELYIRPYWTED